MSSTVEKAKTGLMWAMGIIVPLAAITGLVLGILAYVATQKLPDNSSLTGKRVMVGDKDGFTWSTEIGETASGELVARKGMLHNSNDKVVTTADLDAAVVDNRVLQHFHHEKAVATTTTVLPVFKQTDGSAYDTAPTVTNNTSTVYATSWASKHDSNPVCFIKGKVDCTASVLAGETAYSVELTELPVHASDVAYGQVYANGVNVSNLNAFCKIEKDVVTFHVNTTDVATSTDATANYSALQVNTNGTTFPVYIEFFIVAETTHEDEGTRTADTPTPTPTPTVEDSRFDFSSFV